MRQIASLCHAKESEIPFWTTSKRVPYSYWLKQEAFADRCGFARSYMSRIERGCSNASLDAIEVLADALRIELGSY